jgi:hypothetical protein
VSRFGNVEARIEVFITERDKALARTPPDWGVWRSLTADLRRLGVPDDASLSNPSGMSPVVTEAVTRGPGRPKKPRCEHDAIADRCELCNPELAVI